MLLQEKYISNYMIMDDMKGHKNTLSLWKAVRIEIELSLGKRAFLDWELISNKRSKY